MTLLTTSLFSLEDYEREHDGLTCRRTTDEYLRLAATMLDQPITLVCYCSPHLAERIKDTPHACELVVVPLDWTTLPYYKHLERIKDYRANSPVLNEPELKFTSVYIIMTWTKMALLEMTLRDYPGYQRYGWVDLGISSIADPSHIQEDNLWNQLPSRVRLCRMHYTPPECYTKPDDYYQYLRGVVAAGLITGSSDYLLLLIEAFNQELEVVLACQRAASEETILGRVYYLHPELFDATYGTYEFIFDNYLHLRKYGQPILVLLSALICMKELKEARHLCRMMMNSLDSGHLILSTRHQQTLQEYSDHLLTV